MTAILVPLLVGAAHAVPTLSITGTCPGSVTFSVTGATPVRQVALVAANVPGTFTIPAGQRCAGTATGLGASGVALRAFMVSNASGSGFLNPGIPNANLCELYVQAVDLATCTVSNVQRMPAANVDYVAGVVDGAQEVPARATNAAGTVEGTLDSAGNLAWVTSLTQFNNTLTGAHFHQAAAGSNGAVVHDVSAEVAQVGTNVTGGGTWTGAPAATLLASGIYLNLHSTSFPGGEARGQLEPVDRFGRVVDGLQESPASGSSGTGTIDAWLDASDTLHWTLDTTIDGTFSGAHLHLGAAGTNGAVQHDISAEVSQSGRRVTGSGEWVVPAGTLASLLVGDLYVNVHSTLHPGGEVRGQLLPR